MPVIADASNSVLFGFDHINRNAPVLIRTPKLTRFEPAQYWGGGPPGNSVVLNPLFCFVLFCFVCFFFFFSLLTQKKGRARVEPATYRAATDCSTTELTPLTTLL